MIKGESRTKFLSPSAQALWLKQAVHMKSPLQEAFQLANVAQEYSTKGRAKLKNDSLQIKKAAENAQRERYILAKDHLQLLQKHYAMILHLTKVA
jgi:hypothetical protein